MGRRHTLANLEYELQEAKRLAEFYKGKFEDEVALHRKNLDAEKEIVRMLWVQKAVLTLNLLKLLDVDHDPRIRRIINLALKDLPYDLVPGWKDVGREE